MDQVVLEVVLEQESKPNNLVVEFIYAKPPSSKTKRFDKIPCPVCKQVKCGKHCNNCGKSIRFYKDHLDRWWIYEDGTDIVHYNPETRKGCHNDGTKSGKYLDVNLKRETQELPAGSNFYQDCVVWNRELIAKKQAKIALYNKLTGYGYVERNKTLANYLLVKKWEAHVFEY